MTQEGDHYVVTIDVKSVSVSRVPMPGQLGRPSTSVETKREVTDVVHLVFKASSKAAAFSQARKHLGLMEEVDGE